MVIAPDFANLCSHPYTSPITSFRLLHRPNVCLLKFDNNYAWLLIDYWLICSWYSRANHLLFRLRKNETVLIRKTSIEMFKLMDKTMCKWQSLSVCLCWEKVVWHYYGATKKSGWMNGSTKCWTTQETAINFRFHTDHWFLVIITTVVC